MLSQHILCDRDNSCRLQCQQKCKGAMQKEGGRLRERQRDRQRKIKGAPKRHIETQPQRLSPSFLIAQAGSLPFNVAITDGWGDVNQLTINNAILCGQRAEEGSARKVDERLICGMMHESHVGSSLLLWGGLSREICWDAQCSDRPCFGTFHVHPVKMTMKGDATCINLISQILFGNALLAPHESMLKLLMISQFFLSCKQRGAKERRQCCLGMGLAKSVQLCRVDAYVCTPLKQESRPKCSGFTTDTF